MKNLGCLIAYRLFVKYGYKPHFSIVALFKWNKYCAPLSAHNFSMTTPA